MHTQPKNITAILVILFTISFSTAQLEFKTENPIEFRSSLDLNNNTISNLPDPQTADQAVPESYISSNFLSRTNPTVQGDLALSNNGNIELRGGYLSNDGEDEGIRVLDTGEIRVDNGLLNLSDSTLTGLPVSDDSTDAVRQDQLSNYVKLNGDTLDGNLSFNNQYYITGLQNPINPQDAATKNYVDSGVSSATQDLSEVLQEDNSAGKNIDMNGYDITSTGGEFCVGQYC